MRVVAIIFLTLSVCAIAAEPDRRVAIGFETAALESGWRTEGDVAIDAGGGFKGQNALRLRRDLKDANAPVTAKSPAYDVSPGVWEFTLAAKGAMKSPDTSYAGIVDVELYDAAGKMIDRKTLVEVSGEAAWKPVTQRVEIPANVAMAAFKVRLEKAIGAFYVDELTAAYVAAAPTKDKRIDRVMFIASNPTGLLLPGDSRVFTLRVEATKPLADSQLEATWAVRDYFGAEQLAPAKVTLTKADKPGEKGRIVYTASVDVAAAPLEIGRYYELSADIPQPNDEPYHEFAGFAILPESAANQFKPEEIPFSGRSWDNRSVDHVLLSRRLGIRIIGLRTEWSIDSAAAGAMPHHELVEKMPATWMSRSPCFIVEHQAKGYEKFTDAALRAMVDDYAKKYARDFPTYTSLGNEPHGDIERVRANIAAYKSVYEEFKKVAPNVFCIGTAVGPDEDYFKEGFQPYCDAYDYHTYGGHEAHRRLMAKYRELFKKYGGEKPVWVTELGLNAQGMTRLAIAQEVPKHFAVAFAEGVANASWFGTCFPDPEGRIEGSNGDSFNLFRGKYKVFTPRLDGIAYYNTINSIANKKFAEEKHYGDIDAALFRNAAGRCCQILWADKGRRDVGIPLAGAGKVKLITLDGRWSEVDAGGKGVTVSVSEDPIFMEYDGAAKLADKLDAPAVSIAQLPKSAVKGVAAQVVLSGDGEVLAPPFWTVAKTAAGSFAITPPANSSVREGEITVKLANGELNFRLPVSGKIASQLLPVAATPDQPAAVRLVLRNLGGESQSVAWKVSLEDQAPPINGMYDETKPVTAYFANTAEGTSQIDANATAEIVLPMTNADPLVRYHVRATLKDADGRTTTIDRYIGGFAAVPRGTPKIDGVIDDAAWAKAPVQRIDKAEQYNGFKKSKWDNAADLSANIGFLWDDQNLYIAAEVTDDVFRNVNAGEMLWSGDGLQLLIDAARESSEKPGKYDYVIGLGTKGPQAWCPLSADAGAPVGLCSDIQLAIHRDEKTGGATYEFAISWSRVAPFKPAVGNNLGLALGINEDDGQGRDGLMSWFGNVHSKQLDSVGDLILTN